jgi:hypothetical protein
MAAPGAAAPLGQSQTSFTHAQQIHEAVAERFRQVNRQTRQHRPAVARAGVVVPSSALLVRRLKGNRSALRQAFVVSLIFGPPKAMEDPFGS